MRGRGVLDERRIAEPCADRKWRTLWRPNNIPEEAPGDPAQTKIRRPERSNISKCTRHQGCQPGGVRHPGILPELEMHSTTLERRRGHCQRLRQSTELHSAAQLYENSGGRGASWARADDWADLCDAASEPCVDMQPIWRCRSIAPERTTVAIGQILDWRPLRASSRFNARDRQ